MKNEAAQPIVEVRNLKEYFNINMGMFRTKPLKAVDNVSFAIQPGETLGLVGESGCGKTTVGRTILHLYKPTGGEVLYKGRKIQTKADIQAFRNKASMVFQDPYSSLNPRMTISQAIEEPLALYHICPDRVSRQKRVAELMDTVGLARRLAFSYPHELDGGRRQRVGIARALSLRPKFIVCDEPVSSLDVSIQAQVLNLLKELQAEYGLTYLFITHDLSVVKYFSDKIAVMYLGQLVETASSEELFRSTLHPYSQALLSAIPEPSVHRKMQRVKLTGELTSPIDPQPGCRFAKRCLYARESCVGTDPVLREFGCDHFCSCFRTNALQDEE